MAFSVVRYGEAFKLKVVAEIESGQVSSINEAQVKYGIAGSGTVRAWLSKYGKQHLQARVVRVESQGERDRLKALQVRIRELERALADSQVEASLAKAYFRVACEQFGVQDEGAFKKNIAEKLSAMESRSVGKRTP